MTPRNGTPGWLLRIFKLVAIAAWVVMLAQAETRTFAIYFLDASMLDVLAVLLQVQLALVVAPVVQHVLKPVCTGAWKWLAGRRSADRLRAVAAVTNTFAIEWSGPLGAVLWLWMHERRHEFCRGH
jgi:hypothetical protein